MPQEDAIRVDDVDLQYMFVATDPSTAAEVPQCDQALENSFAYDSKAVDWGFLIY